MYLQSDLVTKMLTFLLAALFQLQLAHSLKVSTFGQMDHSVLAKRAGGGDRRVGFKGPKFPDVTYATRQEDVVLECEAGGSPTPTIHWLKNGERIQQGVSRDYQDDEASYEERMNPAHGSMLRLGKVKSKLFLDCVNDRDEAEYTCVAETPTDRISQTTTLKMGNSISAEPRENCVTKKAFRGEPARIHLWTAVRVEFQGAPVQLFCRGAGYPAPTCTWRYGQEGVPISNGKGYELLRNGDLLITDISWEANMGDYYCTCENESGMDEISTFLYPTSP